MNEMRTAGERVFEQYLGEMQYAYEFEKQFEGKLKRLDNHGDLWKEFWASKQTLEKAVQRST